MIAGSEHEVRKQYAEREAGTLENIDDPSRRSQARLHLERKTPTRRPTQHLGHRKARERPTVRCAPSGKT